MPKTAAAKKTNKKRVRRNVEHGQVHIQASPSSPSLTQREMPFHGHLQAASVSAAPVSPLPMPLR